MLTYAPLGNGQLWNSQQSRAKTCQIVDLSPTGAEVFEWTFEEDSVSRKPSAFVLYLDGIG